MCELGFILEGYSLSLHLENLTVSLSAIAVNQRWFSGNDIEKAAPAKRGVLRPRGIPAAVFMFDTIGLIDSLCWGRAVGIILLSR